MSKEVKAYSVDTKLVIKQRDGFKCFFCDSIEDLTIAHIFVPKRDGGKPVEENGMCICRKCHDKMDFGIGCSIQEQIRMLELCKMYLMFYYQKEFTEEELTLEGNQKKLQLVKKRKK